LTVWLQLHSPSSSQSPCVQSKSFFLGLLPWQSHLLFGPHVQRPISSESWIWVSIHTLLLSTKTVSRPQRAHDIQLNLISSLLQFHPLLCFLFFICHHRALKP
jgi:hypothetical protein